jgi:2-desacetyl-2-hydroxyethyl bacteriochlorophyllide A dehydrogenase
MKAAIWEAPGELRIDSRPDPDPGRGEVVVKVGACGMCGTDLHIADGEFPPAPYPLVPGHEFAGEVVAVGEGVRSLREGARVAVDPSLFCGECEFCRIQRGNLCANWNAIGDTVDGAFAEYVRVPAANAYELPEALSYREAALIEPLACAVHGMDRLAPRVGDSFLITGAGTMGLLLLALTRRGGAARVTMVDINPAKLERARALGADRTAESVAEALAHEELGFDCVIDATGVAPVIEAGFGATRRGGKLMVFGVAPEEARISLSPFRIYNDEVTVIGSMAVLFTFQPAMALLASGVLKPEMLLTHAFALDDFGEALETVRRGEGLKVQVLPNGELR